MRGWLKQGSQLILSVAVSATFVWPAISSAEVIEHEPTSMEMLGDAIVARPMLVVATALGAVVFVVTLPFSALGGNADEAARVLVGEPADALLLRCLGCTGQEDEARDQQADETTRTQNAVDATAAAAQQEASTTAK